MIIKQFIKQYPNPPLTKIRHNNTNKVFWKKTNLENIDSNNPVNIVEIDQFKLKISKLKRFASYLNSSLLLNK